MLLVLLILCGFALAIGLCIGSFLNVVILRSLSDESIVFPASKCPICQHPLKWWHNIPVISYLLLRGKCGFCKAHISLQYPIVELLTAFIFTLIFLRYGLSPETLYFWIVSALLIVIAGTDFKEKVVFDVHTFSLIGVGLFASALMTVMIFYKGLTEGDLTLNLPAILNTPIMFSVIGILLGGLIMEGLARLGYLFAGTRAFGEGDTFIAMGLGAVFGLNILPILIVSVIVQVLLTLPIFIKKIASEKDYLTLTAFSVFVVYAVILFALQQTTFLANSFVYLISAIILAILGVYACYRILRGLKNNREGMTYLPFGPAMVIAALIALIL